MTTKRFFAALLAACLALSMPLPASAAGTAASLDEAVQAVTALGILSGDGTGDLGLERRVTRAEFIALAVKASPGGSGVGQAAASPYPDVPRSHWASGYVEAGVSRGLISGYSDGTFRPNREITLAEGAAIVLALLGYREEDFSGAYPTGQMSMCRGLRLDRGLSAAQAADPLTRQDAVYLFYNLLLTKTREGVPYIQSLGYSLDAAGRPDLVALINRDLEGPAVAQSGWQSTLGFTPHTVCRNGVSVPAGDVRDYDVLYWNAAMGTVWAYSKRTTGLIQAVGPSGANPASVTVAGRAYAIETSAAAYALSDLGQYHPGDTVTLLLGRDGGVAAVTSAAAGGTERIGLVLEVSDASYPDGDGGSYTAQTVTLLAADGQTYQYQTRGGRVRKGSLVRVSAGAGEIVLSALPSSALTGKVSRDGTLLDRYSFAPDVEILDVSGNKGAAITPDRLAGLTLTKGQVRFYTLNSRGEIETLILSDVTGDMHQYGVLTKMESMGEGMFASYSYELDVGGQTCGIPASTTRFPVSPGPVQIKGDPMDPDRILPLTATGDGTVSGNQLLAGSQRYTLSDNVAVYEYRDGRYYLSSLARAEGSGNVTGWYDKAEREGGRVRILVIR